jgi:hypothetical protein
MTVWLPVTELVERLWGCDDPDRLFGVHARTPAPWPRAPRRRDRPAVDLDAVAALVRSPVALRDVDPRALWSSQPWVLREHVSYYRTGRWERTGETSADRFSAHNQFPIVLDDHRSRAVIVAGHHRAAAALLAGRPLTVRVVATDGRAAITPLLWYDRSRPATAAAEVAAAVGAGRPGEVITLDDAAEVLRRLDVDEQVIQWRLGVLRRQLAAAHPSHGTGES